METANFIQKGSLTLEDLDGLMMESAYGSNISNLKIEEKKQDELQKFVFQKLFKGLSPGSKVLPKKYLKITDEEWGLIEEMIKKERMQQLNRLQEIKNKLFGKQITFDTADAQTLLNEFRRIYEQVYTDTQKECQDHIRKVEDKFEALSTKQK